MMPGRVTVRDLAKETGFHFTTVAKALRGDPRIKPETVAAVSEAAERCGYRPDPMLSALSAYRHRRTTEFRGVIGLLTPAPNQDRPGAKGPTVQIYQDLKAHANHLGLKIECHDVSSPGLTGKRLSQILSSRGIHGLLLAPIPSPGAYLDLDWEHFYTVAIGYSVMRPTVHRACFHQARSMRLHLKQLRALGYHRIGLMLTWNADLRTDHNILGSYLAEQQEYAEEVRVRPFLGDEGPAREAIAKWLETEKPDCVMTTGAPHLELIKSLGYDVPRDIGVSTYAWSKANPEIAGIDERWDALTSTALDLLMELMAKNEFGLPTFPRFALIEGVWRMGSSVRDLAAGGPGPSGLRRGCGR